MRIGIVINIDRETLLPYLNNEEEKNLSKDTVHPMGHLLLIP